MKFVSFTVVYTSLGEPKGRRTNARRVPNTIKKIGLLPLGAEADSSIGTTKT